MMSPVVSAVAAAASFMILVFTIPVGVLAQDQLGTRVAPSATLDVNEAQVRTPADIRQAAAARGPAPAVFAVPFRPTMGEVEYELAKAVADAAPYSPKPSPYTPKPSTSGPQAPPILIDSVFTEGVNQATSFSSFPPDPHGAKGLGQFVEVTNFTLSIYDTTVAPPAQIMQTDLPSFFGCGPAAGTPFDPRAIYDVIWNRWVVFADTFANAGRTFLPLAISQTSDATGGYNVYCLDFTGVAGAGGFVDYPELGMDQDSILMTVNVFGGNQGAKVFAVAKALLYNGRGFSVPVFSFPIVTITPPYVLDQNANSFFLQPPPAASAITKITMTNSSHAFQAQVFVSNIPVPAYTVPPTAVQPGTAARLDTLDSRFLNTGTQIGDSLFQVHTIALGSFPAPKFYEFNTATNGIANQFFFFRSGTSFDWNATVAADFSRNVYVTWSATDPPLGVEPEIRLSGTNVPGGVFGGGSALPAPCTSPTFLDQEFPPGRPRWGDYSAVTLDPEGANRAWIINENVLDPAVSPNSWDTCLAQIGF